MEITTPTENERIAEILGGDKCALINSVDKLKKHILKLNMENFNMWECVRCMDLALIFEWPLEEFHKFLEGHLCKIRYDFLNEDLEEPTQGDKK